MWGNWNNNITAVIAWDSPNISRCWSYPAFLKNRLSVRWPGLSYKDYLE